jgi:hypothetical protein
MKSNKQRGFILNPFRFGAGDRAEDPYFSNVSMLLHFDQLVAGQFVDEISGRTWTIESSGAEFDTSVMKFGSGSAHLLGTGRIKSNIQPSDDLGTGDFTIECFLKKSSFLKNEVVIGRQVPGTYAIQLKVTSSRLLEVVFWSGGQIYTFTSSGVVPVDVFAHLAVVRRKGSVRLFIDGVVQGTFSHSESLNATNIPWTIGAISDTANSERLVGWVDDVRITVGVARYYEAFTPPSAAFPNS